MSFVNILLILGDILMGELLTIIIYINSKLCQLQNANNM